MSQRSNIEWTDATWSPITDEVRCYEEKLEEPLHWRKPRRIFVNSMSDTFHDDVPTDFIVKMWIVMSMCPRHTFMVLTKRPERAAKVCAEKPWFGKCVTSVRGKVHVCSYSILPNVWIGAPCEVPTDIMIREWPQ